MPSYQSDSAFIRIDQYEPPTPGSYPAVLLLHGSGGAATYWLEKLAPALAGMGTAVYAPHYFDKTATGRATREMILNGQHFSAWLTALQHAVTYIAARPCVNAQRIGVFGISLGGYLAMALSAQDRRLRAAIELSGGMPAGWEDRLSAAMPPVLILHGVEDNVVPVSEARKLQALLEYHRVPHQVELFEGETHWFSYRSQLRLLMLCAGFLARHL